MIINLNVKNREEYYPEHIAEEENDEAKMIQLKLDLAIQRYEILLEKGRKWIKAIEEKETNNHIY
jgi:hypothetical protein